jgi:RNA polymerase-binding transcription factor DksA
MDIDKLLKTHRDALLKKYKNNSPDHIDLETIEKFVRGEFDLGKEDEEREYNSIIEHLASCQSCKEQVKLVRRAAVSEAELFAASDEAFSEEEVDRTYDKFKIHINRAQTEELALKFIKKLRPDIESLFHSTWSAIKNIPKDVTLSFSKKQLVALGLTEPKTEDSQILLLKIIFTLINVFDEIVDPTDKGELKSRLHYSAKQNKLSKKVTNELIEFMISEYD